MKQKRAYQYRFYSTEGQHAHLARTFGCCHFVSNWALHTKTNAFSQNQQRLSSHDLSKALIQLKKQEATHWFTKVSSFPSQEAKLSSMIVSNDCRDLLNFLSLEVRVWTCPACRIVHNCDLNASKDILAVGLTVHACGESIRPAAVKTTTDTMQQSRSSSE